MNNGKRFTFGIDIRQKNLRIDISQKDPKLSRVVYSIFMIPFKYNLSYADVLDKIMKAMKKNDSDYWMSDS